jgi:hypothetical protein
MTIADVNATSTHRTDAGKNSQVGSIVPIDPSSRARSSSEEVKTEGDRVEISGRARTALAEARESEDLTFARNALADVPPLSSERISELTERINDGYYQQADVIGKIAERVGNELKDGV